MEIIYNPNVTGFFLSFCLIYIYKILLRKVRYILFFES